MKNCSFETISPCHQISLTKVKGLKVLEDEKKVLLHLRSKVPLQDISTICLHHEHSLDIMFSKMKKKCSDPFNQHKQSRTKSLKVVTVDFYSKLECLKDKVVPGEKLCPSCYIQASKFTPQGEVKEQLATSTTEEQNIPNVVENVPGPSALPALFSGSTTTISSSTTDVSNEPDLSLLDVNAALVVLGETPVKKKGLSSKQKSRRGHMKLRSATRSLKRKLEAGYGVTVSSDESETERKIQRLDDLTLYENMMKQLKDKFNEPSTSYAQKLQILTLSPFTADRTKTEFGASSHMVKRSRRLKQLHGILALPDRKKGKILSQETKAKIEEFYEQDEISRICPGKKDYKSVLSLDGAKIQHQRRLLLGNLRELYQKWKEDNLDVSVGFSTFAMSRPKWCILAGAQGTHSVCVCTIHQNPKLMIAAFQSKNLGYSDLMQKTVCSIDSEQCMMRRCKECPGEENLINFLNSLKEETDEENQDIEYKQWVTTDRTTLVTIKESISDFINNLAEKIVNLTRHHYTSKAQSAYLRTLKDAVKSDEECIILGDFAENYSFIVQDAAQGFHWENSQATLHPFVAYYRTHDKPTLQHSSMCIISDSGKHSTAAVHTFQKHILSRLQSILPNLRKVHYFSDGCAGQYKNRYNFINLCHHQEDFNLECEWNFFATSHGKSACDGIGGTLKRLTAKASLQRTTNRQILTPLDMFNFCKESIPNVIVFYISQEEVNSSEKMLEGRFSIARTIPGTQKLHRIIPISTNQLIVFSLSQSTSSQTVKVSQLKADCSEIEDNEDTNRSTLENYPDSSFIACIYEQKWWIGIVKQKSNEHDDLFISFMHPSGEAKQYSWPHAEDACWVEKSNIICNISCPSMTSSSMRGYSFSETDIKKIKDLYLMIRNRIK